MDSLLVLFCDVDFCKVFFYPSGCSSSLPAGRNSVNGLVLYPLGWDLYLHQPVSSAPLPPYAAAARRADLSGLPPAWIGVGTLDLFYEEDLAYAQRLRDSGVACETTLVPGAFHGFDQFGPRFQVVLGFREAQISALRRYLRQG